MSINSRIEKDSLGDIEVPIMALYGAQTTRENQGINDPTPAKSHKALPLPFYPGDALETVPAYKGRGGHTYTDDVYR